MRTISSPTIRPPAWRPALSTAPRVSAPGAGAAAGATQSVRLSFGAAANGTVDATLRFRDANLNASTTSLTVTMDLKANQEYTFSFFYPKGGPSVRLTDPAGKATALSMNRAFKVASSGTYQMTIAAASSLRDTASLNQLELNARSMLPASSGDARVDALVRGGTRQWWRPAGSAPTVGTDLIMPTVKALDADSSRKTLTYSFLAAPQAGKNPAGFQPMTAAQKSAVRQVLEEYSQYINLTFTEAEDGSEGDINFGTDVQANSAGYANLPSGDASSRSYVYLANNQVSNNDAGVAKGGYGWYTILHEVGHALGLKHPGNYNAGGGGTPGPYLPAALDTRQNTMMSYKDSNQTRGVNATTPMMFDIAALQYLYGVNRAGSNADDDEAFTFRPGRNVLKTLWSANGRDTIDVSKLTNRSLINLNGGTRSSINIIAPETDGWYSGNGNVGIAFGAEIDKVRLSEAEAVSETVVLNDAFRRNRFNHLTGVDVAADRIGLDRKLFGAVTAAQIEMGSAATKASTRIVVNNATGEVFYDADGAGNKSVAKKIAQYTTLQSGGSLSAANFVAVG